MCDGGTCKKASECAGEVSNKEELEFRKAWDRDSRIRDLKDKLKWYEMGIVSFEQQTIWNMKNELAKLTGTEKPVKIYQGKWRRDFLEVIK